jgi:hypothetical protein
MASKRHYALFELLMSHLILLRRRLAHVCDQIGDNAANTVVDKRVNDLLAAAGRAQQPRRSQQSEMMTSSERGMPTRIAISPTESG